MKIIHRGAKIDVTVMSQTSNRVGESAFALPTVMIASVVMLMVLLSGLVSASSINAALRTQYEDRLMRQAADSGVAMMNLCMSRSYNQPTWSVAPNNLPLKPNTNCSGTVQSGLSQYIVDTPNLKTSFEVTAVSIVNGAQVTNVNVTLQKYRTSSASTPVSTTTSNRSVVIGSQTGFSNVTFGYCVNCGAGDGAQLAVILATGEVKTLGRNDNGRLGNGNTNNNTDPQVFILPGSERGVAAFSNFLSIGRQISVITANGKVYSAGSNEFGQLGNTTAGTTNPISTPVQFGSLGNSGQPQARYMAVNNYATYAIASNNRIYSAGSCVYGMLGTGCSSGTTATVSALAFPFGAPTSDLNTQPETVSSSPNKSDNFVTDRFNTYVRMKGGAVYGWGINDYGELGTGNTTQSNTPIRMRALGSSGQPYLNATQIAFSGSAMYVLDTTGQVWAAGSNFQGEQLGSGSNLQSTRSGTCMSPNSNVVGATIALAGCNSNDGWQYIEFWPDRTLRFRTDSTTYGPTDSMLCVTLGASNGAAATLQTCNPASNSLQRFTVSPDGSAATGKIIADTVGCLYSDGSNVVTNTACNDSSSSWQTRLNTYFRPVPRPPYDSALGRNPRYVSMSTDNRTTILLDENGVAWSAGGNNRGQQGTGSIRSLFQPVLKKVVLPAGVKVVDIYTTEADPGGSGISDGTGFASYNNSFYVLEDGRVFGSGANNYGQLGNGVALPAGVNAVTTPVQMNLPTGVKARSVQSGFGTTVVLTTEGKVYTVGNNSNGQLGDGTTTSSSTPKANSYTNQRGSLSF